MLGLFELDLLLLADENEDKLEIFGGETEMDDEEEPEEDDNSSVAAELLAMGCSILMDDGEDI